MTRLRKDFLITTVQPNHQITSNWGNGKETDEQSKALEIMVDTNIPIGHCGNGASVNQKTARVLHDLYGFSSPGIYIRLHI